MSEYVLVDGREWYARQQMSQEQYQDADRLARIINDDAMWWEPVDSRNSRYPENQDGRWNEDRSQF